MNKVYLSEIAGIARANGATFDEVMSNDRSRRVVWARDKAIRHFRANRGLTVARIGQIFNLHHTSIVNSLSRSAKSERYEAKKAYNRELRARHRRDTVCS